MSPEIIIRDGQIETKVEVSSETLRNVRHLFFEAYRGTSIPLNRTLSTELHRLLIAVEQVLSNSKD